MKRKFAAAALIAASLVLITQRNVVSQEDSFGFEIRQLKGKPFVVSLQTGGEKYHLLAETLKAGPYIAYFAAEDFTQRKDMTMCDFKKIKVVKDEEDIKGIKAVLSLKDKDRKVVPDYDLIICMQITKGLPCLAVYSKLVYNGQRPVEAGLNWGLSGVDKVHQFGYYACPANGKVIARKLETSSLMRGKATKLGKGAYPWVWATPGDGNGLGIMTIGMLMKNPDAYEIAISDVPPKQKLRKGDYMDVSIILLPTTRAQGGYKPVVKLYEDIKDIKWEMENW